MKVYKPKYRDKDGKNKTCQRWYLAFTHNKERHRLPAFTSKAATEKVGKEIEGILAGRPDFKWLNRIESRIRDRLLAWDLLEPDDKREYERQFQQKQKEEIPLLDHLSDFCNGMKADNRKPHYIGQVKSEIQRILTGCDFKLWSDIDGNQVKVFLAKGRGPHGYGERTYNAYLRAFKTFCAWLIRERRATAPNPMDGHSLIKQTEFRKERRALTFDERNKLLEITEAAKERFRMTGHERALVYRLATEAGLRADELRSLTVISFDFIASAVHVDPSDTKGKKPADLILMPETAADIKELLSGKQPQDRAFNLPCTSNTARMIRADLKAAGIPYRDDAGRDVDFHSLRHTFITNLALAGVHPAVAQKLARHSKIEMTMKFYTHVLHEAEVSAIEKLRNLSYACQNDAQRRTTAENGGKKSLNNGPKTAFAG